MTSGRRARKSARRRKADDVAGINRTVADCINIGYFIQWIRDNQWITLSNLVMLSNLDNPLYKTIFSISNFWIK